MLPRSTSTNPAVLSYYTMRRMVGLIALALPFALAAVPSWSLFSHRVTCRILFSNAPSATITTAPCAIITWAAFLPSRRFSPARAATICTMKSPATWPQLSL